LQWSRGGAGQEEDPCRFWTTTARPPPPSADRGRLAVQPPDGQRVDCRISADPAAHLLVTYGRSGPLGPALRGKITTGGRKPWLGLRLPRLFRQP
jgi:hypothetical protein